MLILLFVIYIYFILLITLYIIDGNKKKKRLICYKCGKSTMKYSHCSPEVAFYKCINCGHKTSYSN